MPRLRWTRLSRIGALASLIGLKAYAETPAWFGPVCETPAIAAAGEHKLLAMVRSAPQDSGVETLLFATPDDRLWAEAASFAAWGVTPPAEKKDSWHPLDAVPGLIYRFDPCRQELWLDSSLAMRETHRVTAAAPARPVASRVSETGGFLNLDSQIVGIDGDRGFAGQAELGVFAGPGFALSSVLNDGARTVRLENSLTLDTPARRERFRLGDSISRAQLLGRSVRFGGVQWGTDFSLQPDLITFPLPSIEGTARLPSAAEIYVDQSLRTREEVPAGPFELTDLPVVSGAGELQLVLRDALGRSQVVSYPFYASPLLLREGLSDYSLQAGWQRRNFGLTSADYADGFAAGTYRRGLSSALTAELRADAASGQQTIGSALSGALPRFGAWTAGASVSNSDEGLGALGVLAHEYLSARWHYSAEARFGSRGFAQLGDPIGDLRHSLSLRLGFAPHRNGSLSAFYLGQDRRAQDELRVAGLNYGWNLARSWHANASLTHSFGDEAEQTVLLTLNYQWDGRSAATFQHDQTRRLENEAGVSRASWQRSAPGPLGLGYRLYAEDGAQERNGASLRWGSGKGVATGDVERLGESEGLRLGFATGFAALGSDFFWTRPVSSSFAVVDTGSVANVRVYSENRLAGRTDDSGVLLVPELRAFEANQLRIDEADVPILFEVPRLAAEIRPPARSGVRVKLAAAPPAAFSMRTLLADGSAPPAGARVELDGAVLPLPLGYGGVAYLSAAPGPHVITLRWHDGACRAQFDSASHTAGLASAPVVCRAEAP